MKSNKNKIVEKKKDNSWLIKERKKEIHLSIYTTYIYQTKIEKKK